MITRPIVTALILFTLCSEINAQATVKGKIYEAETDSAISAANIYNLTTKLSVRSDANGNYSIAATEGEQLVFSMVGFKPDTVIVSYSMLLIQHDVTLYKQVVTLKPVTVTSNYQADSLARRNYYSHMYEKLPGVTGRNTPSHGFGVVLSPLSYFSREARQKRQLKKRLVKEEQEYYVDRSFPIQWVEKVTQLHGDSLYRFMYRYRPSYSFCRKTSREQMLLYINEKLKEFKRP